MLRTRFGLFAFLSLCGALGCSTGPLPGSQANPRSSGGSGNTQNDGSGNGPNIPPGNAGGPAINTDSGEMMDAGDCGSTLDVLYRDFDACCTMPPPANAHPDFEMQFMGDVVRRGLVETTLGTDQKPVFKDSIGHPALADEPDRDQHRLATRRIRSSPARTHSSSGTTPRASIAPSRRSWCSRSPRRAPASSATKAACSSRSTRARASASPPRTMIWA